MVSFGWTVSLPNSINLSLSLLDDGSSERQIYSLLQGWWKYFLKNHYQFVSLAKEFEISSVYFEYGNDLSGTIAQVEKIRESNLVRKEDFTPTIFTIMH